LPRAEFLFSHESSEQKRIASEDLKEQFRYNKVNLLKAYISDVRENTASGNSCLEEIKDFKNRRFFEFWKKLLFDITKWQNRIFTLLGFVLAIFYFLKSCKNISPLTFISFFILYIIILSGISCGQGDRFHLVTFSFVILLLAKFLSETKRFKPFFEPLQK
jgi:cellulose synthase/poly-beta-1,6-N-acetylglucosamine synthase-like glycosyltransferase